MHKNIMNKKRHIVPIVPTMNLLPPMVVSPLPKTVNSSTLKSPGLISYQMSPKEIIDSEREVAVMSAEHISFDPNNFSD